MTAHRRLIFLSFSLAALAGGCSDDEDAFEGYEVVNGEHDPIQVVVASGVDAGASETSDLRDLYGESGGEIVATAQIFPVVVPVEYTAYASPAEEKVTVVVEIGEDYVSRIDRVDLEVSVGSGETIESVELEQDALTPSRFFAFLKPSCQTELRDEDGVCRLEAIEDCVVKNGDESLTVQGRCDSFVVRLWQGDISEATPTAAARVSVDQAPHWTHVGEASN